MTRERRAGLQVWHRYMNVGLGSLLEIVRGCRDDRGGGSRRVGGIGSGTTPTSTFVPMFRGRRQGSSQLSSGPGLR